MPMILLIRISRILLALALAFVSLLALPLAARPMRAQEQTSKHFAETNQTVSGRFLHYWEAHGALAQQGFPISPEFREKSDLNGKSYTVQYFERAVFEYHPENQPPNDVLLSQLGTFQLKKKYPNGAPGGVGSPLPTAAPTRPTAGTPSAKPTHTPTGTNCLPVPDRRKSR